MKCAYRQSACAMNGLLPYIHSSAISLHMQKMRVASCFTSHDFSSSARNEVSSLTAEGSSDGHSNMYYIHLRGRRSRELHALAKDKIYKCSHRGCDFTANTEGTYGCTLF